MTTDPAPHEPLRDVLDDVRSAIGRLWHTVSASPAAVGALLDAVPHAGSPPGAMSAQQIDVLVRSVRAQRQQVRALQTQLAAFDDQLGVLEELLRPLSAVVDTWAAAERAVGATVLLDRLAAALQAVVPPSGDADPDPPAAG